MALRQLTLTEPLTAQLLAALDEVVVEGREDAAARALSQQASALVLRAGAYGGVRTGDASSAAWRVRAWEYERAVLCPAGGSRL